MVDARLTIDAEPLPVPSGFHVADPSSLANRPCWATPVMSTSRSGRTDTNVRFPHSDGMPVRLPVTACHAVPARAGAAAVVGAAPAAVRGGVEVGAVTPKLLVDG